MNEIVTLKLREWDAGQVVDGLQQRLEIYERTLAYHRGEEYDLMENIEADCDECECEQMIDVYQRVIGEITKQLTEQKG